MAGRDELQCGERVVVSNLQTAAHLNGLFGTLREWKSCEQRWVVRLEGTATDVSVRAHNLRHAHPRCSEPILAGPMDTEGMLQLNSHLTLPNQWRLTPAVHWVGSDVCSAYATAIGASHPGTPWAEQACNNMKGFQVVEMVGEPIRKRSDVGDQSAKVAAPHHTLLGRTRLTETDVESFLHNYPSIIYRTRERGVFSWPETYEVILTCPGCAKKQVLGRKSDLVLSLHTVVCQSSHTTTMYLNCLGIPRLIIIIKHAYVGIPLIVLHI
jgi:hypothetical protein